jgi:hypothetical protein
VSTANWLTLIATVVALAATWGGLLVRVRIAEKSIDQFDRARNRQGERIGVVEERLASLEGSARPRRLTRPIPVPREPEESGAK